MSKKRNVFFYLGLSLVLSCCTWMGTQQLGDVPNDTRINAIKTNKHKKEDIVRLWGTPTATTLFEEESWLYIKSIEQNRLFLPQKEIEREVVKITFNKDDSVKMIKKLSLKDGQKIVFDENKTPVEGKELSVIDELIGNFGRFPSTPTH